MSFTLTKSYVWKDGEQVTPKKLNLMLNGLVLSTTLPIMDGTVSLPGLTFISDLDSGLYRIGANNIGVAVNGAKVLDIATTGLAVTGDVSLTGALKLGNAYAVGAVVPTGTITIKDSTGTAYRVPCLV